MGLQRGGDFRLTSGRIILSLTRIGQEGRVSGGTRSP